MSEDIRGKEMSEIGTETLVRALTMDTADYKDTFLDKAREELKRREIDPDQFHAHISVISTVGETVGTVEEALESLRGVRLWTFRVLGTPANETLTINAMEGCFSCRYRDADGETVGVLGYRDTETLAADVRLFLEMRPEWREIARRYANEKWEVLTTSNSIEHLVAVAEELAGRELVYSLRTMSERELEANAWISVRRDGAQLLVRPGDMNAATSVMKTLDEEIKQRFTEAERHAEEGNAEAELACYERLARLRPDEAMVHYNRGAILLDSGRRAESADAFMEAAPLLARDPQLARYLPDIVDHLRTLVNDHPAPHVVKHALATIAMNMDDVEGAVRLYGEILSADGADAAAHAALGRIFYEEGDHDADAERHLRRYLELEPDAPDREGVERALVELSGSDPDGMPDGES